MSKLVVTFDLFSALIDSRSGGSAYYEQLARARDWQLSGEAAYDRWDAYNKDGQAAAGQAEMVEGSSAGWVSYRQLARIAVSRLYSDFDLEGNAGRDADALIESMAGWPLWPDVAEFLPAFSAEHRIGLLSNVDDDIFASTRAARFVDNEVAMTSERLRAYKPAPHIYDRASHQLGPMVHVATSARDVRGALEAGCPVIRLRRPGHRLDPAGPRPSYEAGALSELPQLIDLTRSRQADGP